MGIWCSYSALETIVNFHQHEDNYFLPIIVSHMELSLNFIQAGDFVDNISSPGLERPCTLLVRIPRVRLI